MSREGKVTVVGAGFYGSTTAQRLASQTLNEVASLTRYKGFLYQWYDTANGKVVLNPGQGDCTATSSTPCCSRG